MKKLLIVGVAALVFGGILNAYGFSICAVGDSITRGGDNFVAHRVALERLLDKNGWNVEWKGTVSSTTSWGSMKLCEGYSGYNAEAIAEQYVAHASSVSADVLLLHAGHNYNSDSGISEPVCMDPADIAAAATNAHARIITAARAQNPNVIVLYAKVITSSHAKYSYIPVVNSAIDALAAKLNTSASPVICIDMAEGWDASTDLADGTHPNAAGASKMAAKWFAALEAQRKDGKLSVARTSAPSGSASAATLLYSYDFDQIGESGGLVLAGVNKGRGTGTLWLKQNDGGANAPFCTNGAFCSQYAFCSNNRGNSLWLGSYDTSLGCGTAKGFTISFWLKTTASHQAWSDFFGFRIGGYNYRCEYTAADTCAFKLFMNKDTGGSTISSAEMTQALAGKWKHVAFVFDGAVNFTTYIDGEWVSTTPLYAGGDLNMVFVGQTLYRHGTEERCYPNNSSPTGTAIDNFDIYGTPMSAAQVKSLAEGTRRTIPVLWHFDDFVSGGGNGIQPTNSGTSNASTYKWNAKDYTNNDGTSGTAWNGESTMFGSPYSFRIMNQRWDSSASKYARYWASFRTDGNGAEGLGATAGTGFTFSFWLNSVAKYDNWRSLFGYFLGAQSSRLVWSTTNDESTLVAAGDLTTTTAIPYDKRKTKEWQHICLVWNHDKSAVEIYCDGERVSQFAYTTTPAASDAVNMMMFGPYVPGTATGAANTSQWSVYGDCEATIDEAAFFNYSLSTNEIAWLGTRVPALPALEATNIVRTVSADGSWAGGLASWGVKEWNGEVWGDVSRSTIWPAFEDGNVFAEVAFASAATITNDTFVTPKRLTFSNASGGASVAPTLVCGEDGLFAPQSLEVGAGVTLKVSTAFGNLVSAGTLTFGEGAKIVFDADAMLASDPDEHAWKTIMTFDDVVLPEGDTDVLSHFGVSNGKYGLALVDSGKAVSCKRKYGFIIMFR